MKYVLKNKDRAILEFEVNIQEIFIQALQEKSYTDEIDTLKIQRKR